MDKKLEDTLKKTGDSLEKSLKSAMDLRRQLDSHIKYLNEMIKYNKLALSKPDDGATTQKLSGGYMKFPPISQKVFKFLKFAEQDLNDLLLQAKSVQKYLKGK